MFFIVCVLRRDTGSMPITESEKKRMLVSTSLKVTFVTVFSCLALLLGLFTSAGIASAHSTHVLHSQTSTSQSAEQLRRSSRIFIVDRTFNDFGFNDFGFNDGFDNGGGCKRGVFFLPKRKIQYFCVLFELLFLHKH